MSKDERSCLIVVGYNWHEDIVKNRKKKINILDMMVSNLKENFLPTDYMISLFRKLQNLT